MAADGWAGIGWPEEYGGQGRTAIEQFIFFDESMRVGAPVPMLTINSVAPTIMRYGSQEQKDFFLPKILAGEIHFAIGYTEPDAGTDLASLKTRAERDGDEYVINGQKVFTSLATDADYIWLAVRTDPERQEAQGHLDHHRPDGLARLQGRADQEHGRPRHERHVLRGPARPRRQPRRRGEPGLEPHHQPAQPRAGHALLRAEWWSASSRTRSRGPRRRSRPTARRVIDQEWVQINLARVHARLEFLKLANFKVAAEATQGAPLNPADASVIKVFGTEFYLEAFRLLMEIVGPSAPVKFGSPEAVLKGRLEARTRSMHILTFGGGTNEMQRDLIAHLRPQHARLTPVGDETTVDFTLSEEQQELQGLAKQILGDRMSLTHLRELDNSEDWFDRETWAEFAKANLLGVALPEDIGGLGYGFLELCLILVEQGRTVAPLPVAPHARLRRAAHRRVRHRGAARGAARRHQRRRRADRPRSTSSGTPADEPQTIAEKSGDGWRITGEKVNVPAGAHRGRDPRAGPGRPGRRPLPRVAEGRRASRSNARRR